jgi:hypothetical protein
MGFSKTDGPKNPYLPLSLIHGSHHIGEDDKPSDEKDDHRNSDREFLEMTKAPSWFRGSV